MSSPLQHYLPYINAGLFVTQLGFNANMNAFGAARDSPTPDIPIAPAPYAFLIWLVIYAFTASTVAIDAFYSHYSFFSFTSNPKFYRRWFALTCITNIAFVVFNNWLGNVHLGMLDLFLLWGSLLPLYLVLVRRPAKHPNKPWVHYFASEFGIRIYFGWVSVATLLTVAASLQSIHGAYLGFSVYAFLLMLLMVFGGAAFVHGKDPVVPLVITWALVGLAVRDATFPGRTQNDFDKLQGAAELAAPIFPALIVIEGGRKLWAYWKSRKASDVELIKPVSKFQTNADYGTV